MTASAQYVYGVVPAKRRAPAGTGVARRRLRTIQTADASAIVSDVPGGELHAGRDDLLAHARVLERALEAGVVLPMRFGMLMADPDSVRDELLREHRDDLLDQLELFDGKVELHVRAMYDETALMSELIESNPGIAARNERLGEQPDEATYYARIELGQLVAEGVERARAADASAIFDALEPLAVAAQAGEPDHEHFAAQFTFLVERELLSDFDQAVDDLGRRNDGRLRIKYTGPLPVYSFVQLPERV
ncbi:MAG TPA: GvpL/GvpF family gas vesicle protein [Solirubrobacteraceae bacterium]|jgi:hypothetical protein